jgi:hypothetical protein
MADRLRRPGVGLITALTCAPEVRDTSRFRSIKQAISHCWLCGAERSSADKVMGTPISMQRLQQLARIFLPARLRSICRHSSKSIPEDARKPHIITPHDYQIFRRPCNFYQFRAGPRPATLLYLYRSPCGTLLAVLAGLTCLSP